MDNIAWALLCLKAHGLGEKSINEVLDLSQTNDVRYSESLSQCNGTKNNTNNISWYKTPDDKVIMFHSVNEYRVFEIFLKGCSIHNQLAISKENIQKYLGINKRSATAALDSLIEKGFIAVVEEQKKNQPKRYMVNPSFRSAGSTNLELLKQTWEILTKETIEKQVEFMSVFESENTKKIYTKTDKIKNKKVCLDFDNPKTLFYNIFSLEEPIEEQKKESDDAATSSNSEIKSADLTNDSNNNIDENKTKNKSKNKKNKPFDGNVELSKIDDEELLSSNLVMINDRNYGLIFVDPKMNKAYNTDGVLIDENYLYFA